jgi:hypothetical protein
VHQVGFIAHIFEDARSTTFIMRSFIICTPTHYCVGGKIEKNEMGRHIAQRCIQGFGGETLGKETTRETQA